MTQQKRLIQVLLLNLSMILGLLIVGLSSHSLGVLAAGADFAADSVAIGLGILAIRISNQPHGNPRAVSIVALINSIALLLATVFVIYGAFHRLATYTPQIEGLSVMVISIAATVVMFISAHILGRDAGKEDLHMRSVLLDTVADGASAAAVAVTGGIIFLTGGFYWLDSVVTLFIGFVIGFSALKLLRDVVKRLSCP
jgi:cobalt-zinc-cadmium efflux system protein